MLPGANVLSVEYKGATNVATLTADGRIECVVRGEGVWGVAAAWHCMRHGQLPVHARVSDMCLAGLNTGVWAARLPVASQRQVAQGVGRAPPLMGAEPPACRGRAAAWRLGSWPGALSGCRRRPTCAAVAQVQGQSLAFESPSAFSIYLKRLINPARKADDGWKTVKYDGKFLEHYKVELARRRFAGAAPPAVGFSQGIHRVFEPSDGVCQRW